MLEGLLDVNLWAALLALTTLEIVLGIDNVVFVSLITQGLPAARARTARRIGLFLALLFRIALLYGATSLTALTWPLFALYGHEVSWRDIILFGGGLFLIVKATQEIHGEVEGEDAEEAGVPGWAGYGAVIGHIILIDIVFSMDSIITAIAMSDRLAVMIAAVAIAVAIMYLAAEPVSGFISRHPTTKMLALSFLMLIGATLIADAAGHPIPRAYIYSAMAFSVMVEMFNLMAFRRRLARKARVFARRP